MTAWEAFWDNVSVLDAALAVIAVVLVVGFVAKGWPWIRALFKLIDTLGTLPSRLDLIDQRLSEIHHETHTNDGSSIKDAVNRIEKTQNEHVDLLANALLSDDQIAEALVNLEQRFADHEDTATR